MFRRPAAVLLALALAAGLAACGGEATPTESPSSAAAVATVDPELGALATEFIGQLVAGEYEAAVATFDDTMSDALPAEDLAGTWQQLTDQVGSYQNEITRRQEVVDEYEAVIVTAQFEKSPLDIRIVFDADRRIAGLFFQPASTTATGTTAEAWVSPSYAGDHEIGEVTVGEYDLPGTLTTPVGDGPWPAVVLVHGSGPNDRDETIGPNKPFRDLALGLATQGIAVLTYDKRTLARPTDLPADLTVAEEVVDDAVAAVELLRAAPGVDPGRVFLVGHSLGGMLAPRIAVESDGVAGLVLMAAPARPLEELILEQTRYLAERDGTVTTEEEDTLADVALQVEAVRDPALDPSTPASELLGAPASYWLDLRDYRQTEMAAGLALEIPFLVLHGQRDHQVTTTDFELWQEALAGGEEVEFRSFPGLNHLMMAGEGEGLGGPEDYEVAGHVAPEVVDAVAAFIRD